MPVVMRQTGHKPGQKGRKVMEWRIRESGHGGYCAEYGVKHEGGVHLGFCNGATMPAFIVYESHRFDTENQAQRYIRSRTK